MYLACTKSPVLPLQCISADAWGHVTVHRGYIRKHFHCCFSHSPSDQGRLFCLLQLPPVCTCCLQLLTILKMIKVWLKLFYLTKLFCTNVTITSTYRKVIIIVIINMLLVAKHMRTYIPSVSSRATHSPQRYMTIFKCYCKHWIHMLRRFCHCVSRKLKQRRPTDG